MLFIFSCFLLPLLFEMCESENMLWIEDIVESTPAPSFSINSRMDIASFVHLHKVITRSIFSAFSNAQNEGELEGQA